MKTLLFASSSFSLKPFTGFTSNMLPHLHRFFVFLRPTLPCLDSSLRKLNKKHDLASKQTCAPSTLCRNLSLFNDSGLGSASSLSRHHSVGPFYKQAEYESRCDVACIAVTDFNIGHALIISLGVAEEILKKRAESSGEGESKRRK